MPLGINGYNDAFKAFTDFATQAKGGSTIAQVGGEKNTVVGAGPLAGRTIVAKTGFDFIGNVGRRQASRDVNNEVRDLFKQAIADMFGGPDNIPDSVKDAMKMADFGKGKPLTARRILAVKTAVDQVAEAERQAEAKMNDCIAKGKVDISKMNLAKANTMEEAHRLVDVAFSACGGNTDAMDILFGSGSAALKKNIMRGDGFLRSEADVQQKVKNLVANLDELKGLSKANPRIYDLGKAMLRTLGKPVPKGVITKILQCTGDASLADLKKLSASSSGMAIHKAVKQLGKFILETMVSSGADAKLDGAEEKEHVRHFIASALLARLDESTLGKMHAAMTSQNNAKLNRYYESCNMSDLDCFDDQPLDIKQAAFDAGSRCSNNLAKLHNSIISNLEILNPDKPLARIPDFDEILDIEDIGGFDLVDDTIAIGKEMLVQEARSVADAFVQGSGRGADAMKKIITDKLDGLHDPLAKLGKSLRANANAMMNWSIGGEMKKLAADGGESSQFKKDIVRGTNATLTDGKTTIKLTQNFETARDELAQFVTGDPKATYKGLAEAANKVAETAADKAAVQKAASDRNKVHLLMALISQETEKAGENGAEHAMDPREAEGAFTITGFSKHDRLHGIGADASRTFVVAKRADGGIDLNYTMDKPLKEVDDGTTDGDGYKVGDGSKFVCKLNYTLKGAEFNRLAQLDFGKFDDSEGKKIYDKKIDMPDGTRQFREHKLEKVVDSFPEEFKVKADCRMDFTLTLNQAVEEEIAAQRDAGPIVA